MTSRPEPSYTIDFDPGAGLLRVRHIGFMSSKIYERYRGDFNRALRESRGFMPQARVLVDMREMDVMPVEVTSRMGEVKDWFVETDRIAMVVGSSLLKIQLRRLANAPAVRTFSTEAEARRWLTDADSRHRSKLSAAD